MFDYVAGRLIYGFWLGFAVYCVLAITGCGRPHDGPPGAPGIAGVPGIACSVDPVIHVGQPGDPVPPKSYRIVCPSGSILVSDGNPGLNAPSVTVVQLCPGYTPSYPDSFPEVALCLSGSLYGVFNDGVHPLAFLAALPPGNYASYSPQGCNLTIGLNCAVSR